MHQMQVESDSDESTSSSDSLSTDNDTNDTDTSRSNLEAEVQSLKAKMTEILEAIKSSHQRTGNESISIGTMESPIRDVQPSSSIQHDLFSEEESADGTVHGKVVNNNNEHGIGKRKTLPRPEALSGHPSAEQVRRWGEDMEEYNTYMQLKGRNAVIHMLTNTKGYVKDVVRQEMRSNPMMKYSPRAVYNFLLQHFVPRETVVELKNKLYNVKQHHQESALEYKFRVERLRLDLAVHGYKASESDIIEKYISGLSDDQLRFNIMLMHETRPFLRLQEVSGTAHKREMVKKSSRAAVKRMKASLPGKGRTWNSSSGRDSRYTTLQHKRNYNKSSRRSYDSRSTRPMIRCYSCGMMGHRSSECKRKRMRLGEVKGPCGKCHRMGHSTEECRTVGSAVMKKGQQVSKCNHCGKMGHNETKCWIKYPEQRPMRKDQPKAR